MIRALTAPGLTALVMLFGLLVILMPATAQDINAGPANFSQPGPSTTIQGEGIAPIPLNRADSDRMAIALASKYITEGRFAEAVKILSALRQWRSKDPNVEALLTWAETAWSSKLMAEGGFAEAMEILSAVERRRPENRDIQILLARSEVALGRSRDAIRRLEALVPLHPDWPRPRMELALAHAAAGNFRTGKRILVAELGKDPPPHVRRNLEAAIRQLEDKQNFVGRVSVGVTPDTNVTGGTYNDSVEFLGLPFTLNDDAKQKSGVHGDISTGGTLRTDWKQNARLELALDLRHSEPLGEKGTQSSNARLAAAMRARWPKGSMLTGLAVQPFYWDNELQRIERSVFLDGGRHIGGPVALVGNVTLIDGVFADLKLRNFRQWETGLGPSFTLSPNSRLQVNGIFGGRNAESDLHSFDRRGVSANLVMVPFEGWRLTAAGALTRDVYREESVAFGTTQEDLIAAANLSVVKIDWVLWGLSPSFGLGYSEVRSTIDLYDKRSYTINLGVALPY